jgi:hypothetical protein
LALLAAVLFLGWRLLGPASPPPGVELGDLKSVDQLKERFNQDGGVVRLVLILSPT